MTLHAHNASNSGAVAYNKNTCPQCGQWLLAPDWSEYRSERCVRHIWSCEACHYSFETDVFFAPVAAAAQAA